ncbi:MAG: SUMF1/EgtB/PvdO family nonheme iron enzyme [Planctomycetes bacterium]|nr:SUMF1/EgtB/PvdO family nonheme iron enzyme [Planctomycetota bacterium]
MPEQDPILSRNAPLGPYTIVRKLGQGGMGGVYLGMHKVLQVNHAIKVIHPRLVTDPKVIERFMREARHAAKLNHPNIIPVVGADTVDGIPYIAMQFVNGQTLAQVTAKQSLEVHAAVRYVHMVANALAYAHSRKVIHRDIKPANIMVDEEDVAKLMDFGLVRDMSQGPDAQATSEQLTMAGLIVGTPQYMPPEQWHGEGLDHRCDVFSLGVTLYYLICGNFPYPGKNTQEIFRAIMGGNPVPLAQRMPDVSPALAAIIDKSCESDAAARYQSAGEFAQDLESWWSQNPAPQGNSQLIRRDGTTAIPAGSAFSSRSGQTRGGTTLDIATLKSRSGSAPSQSGLATPVEGAAAPSNPTLLQAPASNKTILVAALVIVLVLASLGIGGFVVFGGKDPAPNATSNTPVIAVADLKFDVGVATSDAVESNPLRVAMASYSVPGTSNGKVTLNGKPYDFGAAISLEPGLNKLELVATGDAGKRQGRTLFVVLDTQVPELQVPGFALAQDGRLPLDAASYRLQGKLVDDDPGAGIELLVDGALREITLRDGAFDINIPLADSPIQLELRAADRAGNRAAAQSVWLIPDRLPLSLEWADGDSVRWFTTRAVTLDGSAGKSQGVTVESAQGVLPLDKNGGFTLKLDLAPGRHVVKLDAKDWLGRKSSLTRTVVVDLQAPEFVELEPTDASVLRLETLPAKVAVRGKLDGPEAVLTINGFSVPVGSDGSFAWETSVDKFGDFNLVLAAKDPAGRTTERKLSLVIKAIRFQLIGKNAQGFAEYKRLSDGMTMVLVPAGKFDQGVADKLGDAPRRNVAMTAFLIGKYEVTKEQFCRFLNERKITPADVTARKLVGKDLNGGMYDLMYVAGTWSPAAGSERQAATGVTWMGAREYSQWADPEGDLPSEAQWEYAARGSDGRAYPWGNDPPNPGRGHYLDGGLEAEAQVVDICKNGASPFGVQNLAGNVEEWCLDWYDAGAYTRAGSDPKVVDKPSGGDRRVVRGGSFKSPVKADVQPAGEDAPCDLRAFFRGRRLPDTASADRGFRVASTANPEA